MRNTFIVVKEIPEWKFKTNIAQNSTSERNEDQILAHFGSKTAKSDNFQGFYFS